MRSVTQNHLLWLLFACCVGALAIAILAEHAFSLKLCVLCVYQRYIFAAAALIAVLGARFLDVSRWLVFTILLALFMANAGLAGYQVALEYGWIAESIFCQSSSNLLNVQSIEELRNTLVAEEFKDCSIPDKLFFGLSIAFYNVFFSLALAIVSMVGIVRRDQSS